MCWVKSRFQKHMLVKQRFVKDFTRQWSDFVGQKISAEYDEGKSSQTAKVFVSTPSWFVKQMAEREFDMALQRKCLNGVILPKRVCWIDQELLRMRSKRKSVILEKLLPSNGSPSNNCDTTNKNASMTSINHQPDRLITLALMTESSKVKSKRIKKKSDKSQKGVKKSMKNPRAYSSIPKASKTFTFKPLPRTTINLNKSSEMQEKSIPPAPRTVLSNDQDSPSPLKVTRPTKKRNRLSLAHLQECFDELLKPRLNLKAIFIAARFIARVQIGIENKAGNVKVIIIRKLSPKPRFKVQTVCRLSQAVLEQYLQAIMSRLNNSNMGARAFVH